MSSNLTEEQKTEIEKLLKYIKNMESIVRTSPSQEQKARVQKDLQKYREKLRAIITEFDPTKMSVDDIRKQLNMSAVAGPAATEPDGKFSILRKYPEERASAHSNDPDVNFLASILQILHKEYWPVLSDIHCKLDFSHSGERDSLRTHLENTMRNLKVLAETIEEYAGAEKQDFREQLLKMKNRQTRTFIFETNEVLKKIRDFIAKLTEDVENQGAIIRNKDSVLKFNSRFEEATELEGKSLSDGILEFDMFVREAISHLNLPELKIRNE